ncbi:MAG TPA: TIM barrel protein [Terracidiphilus sp.]|jgi:sugar phosphate isomerase/epimerase|nr:TIM barrel protein [Terracidiphilus sp.]
MKSTRISRREFVRLGTGAFAAAATATLGARQAEGAQLHAPIGLQLYSVRNLLPKDFDGTLRALHSAGYREVEAAGYYDKSAADFRHAMDAAGLRCISTHHDLQEWKQQGDQLIEYGHTLGLDYMICSSADGVHRHPAAKGELTLDDWRYVTDEWNRLGAKVKAAGMTFGIHNHIPEFANYGGTIVYDELLRLTDPKLVVFEMDCGWVTAAGHNPVDYLSKTPERFPLLHVKDMERRPDGKFHSVVMGTGVVDYHAILRAATGMKHYFIEQEEFKGDPMTELRADAAYMRSFTL